MSVWYVGVAGAGGFAVGATIAGRLGASGLGSLYLGLVGGMVAMVLWDWSPLPNDTTPTAVTEAER